MSFPDSGSVHQGLMAPYTGQNYNILMIDNSVVVSSYIFCALRQSICPGGLFIMCVCVCVHCQAAVMDVARVQSDTLSNRVAHLSAENFINTTTSIPRILNGKGYINTHTP